MDDNATASTNSPHGAGTRATAGGLDKSTDDSSETPEPDPAHTSEPDERKISDILNQLAVGHTADRVMISDIVTAMEGRAIGALLLFFALPNTLPTPPGTSGILGLPLIFLSVQMMLGRLPWLPRFIADRSLSREDFRRLMGAMSPWLARAERLLSPRFPLFSQPASERALGALCLVLSVVLFLPIPLGNMLPAFAICLIALGLLERDGLWIGFGAVTGIAALIIVWGVIYALLRAALFLLGGVFA